MQADIETICTPVMVLIGPRNQAMVAFQTVSMSACHHHCCPPPLLCIVHLHQCIKQQETVQTPHTARQCWGHTRTPPAC